MSCLLLAEGENATELSLVENAHRTEMHPDHECAAFAELADGGMELEDIGARFGVTEVVVRRRLRLTAHKTAALRLEFGANPRLAALAAVVHAMDLTMGRIECGLRHKQDSHNMRYGTPLELAAFDPVAADQGKFPGAQKRPFAIDLTAAKKFSASLSNFASLVRRQDKHPMLNPNWSEK